MNAQVSLVKCQDYQFENINAAVSQSIDLLGGMAQFVKPFQKVLIKPNILTGTSPEKSAVTHPEIIRAVIKKVKQAGGIPCVGDSPGFETSKNAAKKSGILQVIKAEGAYFAGFNQGTEVSLVEGDTKRVMTIADDVLAAEVVINIAKLKSHGFTGITAAVKNLFGCVPGLIKSQYHLKYPKKNDFELMLLDILKFVKPVLNIVDAVVVMEGEGGPATGAPRAMNVLLSGTDAVAVDSVCAVLTGKNPTDFNLLRLAEKLQVGETRFDNIEILGDNFEEHVLKDFKHITIRNNIMLPGGLPPVIISWMRKVLLDRPKLTQKKCAKCGVCEKVCAARAITVKNGWPTFNYDKCLGCYCCQEMCEFSAIHINKSLMAKIIFKIASLLSLN